MNILDLVTWSKYSPLKFNQIISPREDHNTAEQVDGGEDACGGEGGHILGIIQV